MTPPATGPIERFASRIIFGFVGLVAFVFGIWDLTSAIGLAPRVFGAFLIAIGSFALIGAAGPRARWAAWPAWAAAIAVLATGIVALSVEIRDRMQYHWEDTRHLGFGFGCTLVGFLMLALVWRNRPEWPPRVFGRLGSPNKTPLENLKDVVELLGVTGLVLAATAFWFTEVYTPSSRLPTVNVVVELVPSGASAVHTQFTLENKSDFRVRMLSSYFNIVLSDAGTGYDADASACGIDAQGRLSASDYPGSPAALGRSTEQVINAGRLGADGQWLEPDETLTVGVVSPIPRAVIRNAPRVARASMVVTVARGDRVALVPDWHSADIPAYETDFPATSDAPACAERGHVAHTGTAHWPVVQESAFNLATRDPIELWTDWWISDDGRVTTYSYPVKDAVEVNPSRDPMEINRRELKLAQLLGLVATGAVQEVTIMGTDQ